jgi:hypothetical protein
VNGRIVAVTRTFHLGGRPPESFACLVPEEALRLGPNTVQVLAVTRRGGRPRVQLIGRV